MLADFPPYGPAHGDAAELLESPRLGAPQLHPPLNSGISGSLLELVIEIGANAVHAASEMGLAERGTEYVQYIKSGLVPVPGVYVETSGKIVADRVLAR